MNKWNVSLFLKLDNWKIGSWVGTHCPQQNVPTGFITFFISVSASSRLSSWCLVAHGQLWHQAAQTSKSSCQWTKSLTPIGSRGSSCPRFPWANTTWRLSTPLKQSGVPGLSSVTYCLSTDAGLRYVELSTCPVQGCSPPPAQQAPAYHNSELDKRY